MKREDIDLIQRWLYTDQLSEQDVQHRIMDYGLQYFDVAAAIEIAKLQKQYEQGHLPLEKLQDVYKQYQVK